MVKKINDEKAEINTHYTIPERKRFDTFVFCPISWL
jgi:hypothetical protein